MASYHCSVKVGNKGKAASHAKYICREDEYSGSDRYGDIEATGIGNMPRWADHDSSIFWNASDEYERKNGSVYREIEIALPNELSEQERTLLVEDFVKQALGDSHAYQWAIHCPKSAIAGISQPHAHIMYSERVLDGIDRDPDQFFKRYNAKYPDRGGCRKDSAGTKERLQETRELWASIQNKHLEMNGHDSRVDHRTLAEQGVQRSPETHLGWIAIKTLSPDDKNILLESRGANANLAKAEALIASVIPDIKSEIQLVKELSDKPKSLLSPETKLDNNIITPRSNSAVLLESKTEAKVKTKSDYFNELMVSFKAETGITLGPDIKHLTSQSERSGLVLFGNEQFSLIHVGRREHLLIDRDEWPDIQKGNFYKIKAGVPVRTPVPSGCMTSYYGENMRKEIDSWIGRDKTLLTKNRGHSR